MGGFDEPKFDVSWRARRKPPVDACPRAWSERRRHASRPFAPQSVTLRYGHNNEPASIAGAQADWFAEAVGKHSGGDIAVEVFPSSQLGKLQELAEAVSLGTIAFSHNTAGGIGSLYEPFAALDTPYLYRDVDHLMKVMDVDSPVMQELNQGLIEAANVRVIYAHYFGRRWPPKTSPI